jgi:uncharacterized protein DUF3465
MRRGMLGLACAVAFGLAACDAAPAPETAPRPAAVAAVPATRPRDFQALDQAIRRHAAGVWVDGEGVVERVLRDDLRGRRHQRFVLALPGGDTLLVAHNTQLAERAPVKIGQAVRFHGRYEWNARGGVVHWTHRDPAGGEGGWLEVEGRRYD